MESGEALRQVLDKFTNELALLEEELNLVHEQIGELESRLVDCQKRQQSVGTDREKVLAMLGRYVPGAPAISSSAQPAVQTATKPVTQSATKPVVQTTTKPATKPASQPDMQWAQPSIQPDTQWAQPTIQPDTQWAQPTMQPGTQWAQPSIQPDTQWAQPDIQPTGQSAGQPDMQPTGQSVEQADMSWNGQSAMQPTVQAPEAISDATKPIQTSETQKPDNRSPIFNLMASKRKTTKEEKSTTQQAFPTFSETEQSSQAGSFPPPTQSQNPFGLPIQEQIQIATPPPPPVQAPIPMVSPVPTNAGLSETQEAAPESEATENDEREQVKNINDALRSLFNNT